jgi:hypothetical protein
MDNKPMIPTDRQAGIIAKQPIDTNPAFASNFRLVIPKIRLATYFCTEVSFPDLSCEPIRMAHPFAGSLKFFGNKITHGDMNIKFLINEDYSNYNQLNDWFKATLIYDDFFKNGDDVSSNLLSNTGHLLVLTSKKNPVARFRFDGLMITGLSSIEYNSALTDASPATATATFTFTAYDLEAI